MPLRSRGVPRFLPTLTEVVQVGESATVADGPEVPGPTHVATPVADVFARQGLERARAAVRAHVHQAMNDWLREQLASPVSPLSLKLDEVARQALLGTNASSTASTP